MQTELDGIADTPSEFVRHIILDGVIPNQEEGNKMQIDPLLKVNARCAGP